MSGKGNKLPSKLRQKVPLRGDRLLQIEEGEVRLSKTSMEMLQRDDKSSTQERDKGGGKEEETANPERQRCLK